MSDRDLSGRFKSSRPDEMQRIEVAQAAGLPATFAARLKGATLVELTDDAAALAGEIGVQQAAPETPAGEPSAGGDWLDQAMRGGSTRQQAAPETPATEMPATGGGFDSGAGRGTPPRRGPSMDDAIRGAFGVRGH